MNSQSISTLDSRRCAWDSSLNNMYVSIHLWTCRILLLHGINFKQILWWIPIKFIWLENILTFMDIVVSRRVCDYPTSLSFHFHWDKKDFWCLNSHLPMWISQVIAYLKPKLSALFWFYQWFFHPIYKPQALYKIQYCHLPWIKCQHSNTCV